MYVKTVWRRKMKETTALNQISRIVDKLSYKSAYIEIQTETDRFVLEKEKKNPIGFRINK